MLRVIFGFSKTQHINMQKLREKIELMSVNQMCVYHTILEAHNINVNSSSEQIKLKWSHQHEVKYFFRSEEEMIKKSQRSQHQSALVLPTMGLNYTIRYHVI